MKKLDCAKCGKVVKSLSKAQKGTAKVPDRGDNSENYKYGNKDKWGRPTTSKWYGFDPKTKKFTYASGGSTLSKPAIKKAPVQIYGIPQENMGTSGQYGKMRNGGIIDPQKKAAREEKRTERKITNQIKKSVKSSGKIVKAKRGGIKK
jgi:hypothetical protein